MPISELQNLQQLLSSRSYRPEEEWELRERLLHLEGFIIDEPIVGPEEVTFISAVAELVCKLKLEVRQLTETRSNLLISIRDLKNEVIQFKEKVLPMKMAEKESSPYLYRDTTYVPYKIHSKKEERRLAQISKEKKQRNAADKASKKINKKVLEIVDLKPYCKVIELVDGKYKLINKGK